MFFFLLNQSYDLFSNYNCLNMLMFRAKIIISMATVLWRPTIVRSTHVVTPGSICCTILRYFVLDFHFYLSHLLICRFTIRLHLNITDLSFEKHKSRKLLSIFSNQLIPVAATGSLFDFNPQLFRLLTLLFNFQTRIANFRGFLSHTRCSINCDIGS